MKSYYQLVRHSGNQDLFRAVEMAVSALKHGVPFHLHAEGLRGTGKTSIFRAAKDILPHIERIKGCIYNCEPSYPHCPHHSHLTSEQIKEIGSELIPCPFLEISHAAKVGTVVGSIDLGKLTNRLNPVAAVLPGTVPQAHRGIIFIDEINRLADTSPEIADVLLAVMGTKPGRVQIEESGLPVVEIPVSVTIWAASNPDEEPGCLTQVRRQLADRFDMVIPMGRPNEYKAISEILSDKKPTPVLRNESVLSGLTFTEIQSGEQIRSTLANIYVDFGLESIRAIEAIETGARLNAMLAGRATVQTADLISVVPFALGHRTDSGSITSILKYLETLDKSLITNTPNNNFEISQVPALPSEGELSGTESLLKRMWRQFKSVFKSTSPKKQHNMAENKQSPSPEPQKSNGSMRGGPQSSPADPLKTDIISPAKVAAPLITMKIENYVSDDGDHIHGR